MYLPATNNISEANGAMPQTIRDIISARGLKMSHVARQAGISPVNFSAMLTGRRLIKIDDVVRLAVTLNVSPNVLFGLEKSA
jgi:plasmid maintenance system antidote protein VapI